VLFDSGMKRATSILFEKKMMMHKLSISTEKMMHPTLFFQDLFWKQKS